MKKALFIGRTQPITIGHVDLLKQVKEAGFTSLIYGVGSSNSELTPSNPFSAEERRRMVEPVLQHLGFEYRLVDIPDIFDPPNYARHVEDTIRSELSEEIDEDNTVLVCAGSSYTIDCFVKHGKNYEVMEPKHRIDICATQVRTMIAQDCPWQDYVAESTIKVVEEVGGVARIKELFGKKQKNPVPTADVIIRYQNGIVLVERRNPPYGWALPGGFVDHGEDVWNAAPREVKEETNLDLDNIVLFNVYGNPDRDPRQHTQTTVFAADGSGKLAAKDDAKNAGVFSLDALPEQMAFDHREILEDYKTAENQ